MKKKIVDLERTFQDYIMEHSEGMDFTSNKITATEKDIFFFKIAERKIVENLVYSDSRLSSFRYNEEFNIFLASIKPVVNVHNSKADLNKINSFLESDNMVIFSISYLKDVFNLIKAYSQDESKNIYFVVLSPKRDVVSLRPFLCDELGRSVIYNEIIRAEEYN